MKNGSFLYDFCHVCGEEVQAKATHSLRHYIVGEDRSLLGRASEYRTPPELRPSWAIPPLKLRWEALEDHLIQISNPQCHDCDDTQTGTPHGGLDFLE